MGLEPDEKPASKSLTVQGAIVAALAAVLPIIGVQPDMMPHILNIVAALGAVVAIYGRIRATQRIA